MLDDFAVRAVVAGLGIAIFAAPFGCFVVWRRRAYFGDTLAHSSLLGVSIGSLLSVNLTASIFVVCLAIAALLSGLIVRARVGSDALLGLLSHGALALGLVSISLFATSAIDLNALLFGDIFAVTRTDIALIWIGGVVAAAAVAFLWRDLWAATVSETIAAAEGLSPRRADLVFTLLLSGTVALSIRLVGVLLITALLIIPAVTARRFSKGPEAMLALTALVGSLSVLTGLGASFTFDTPAGPSIVVGAILFFTLSQFVPAYGMGVRGRRLI